MSEERNNHEPPKGTRIWVRIERELKARAREKARKREQTLSDYVRASVEEQVKRDEAAA